MTRFSYSRKRSISSLLLPGTIAFHKQSDQKDISQHITLVCQDDNVNKSAVAKKLHCQFAHPHRDKIRALLKDAEINDQELFKCLKDLDNTCETYLKVQKDQTPTNCRASNRKNF